MKLKLIDRDVLKHIFLAIYVSLGIFLFIAGILTPHISENGRISLLFYSVFTGIALSYLNASKKISEGRFLHVLQVFLLLESFLCGFIFSNINVMFALMFFFSFFMVPFSEKRLYLLQIRMTGVHCILLILFKLFAQAYYSVDANFFICFVLLELVNAVGYQFVDRYNDLISSVFANEQELRERVQVAQEKENEAMAAARRNKALFLKQLTEEIKTPVSSIVAYNDRLRGLPVSKDVYDVADAIEGSGRILLSLLNDIEDISGIASGTIDFLSEEYSIRDVMSDVVFMVKPHANLVSTEIVLDISGRIPELLRGDANRIRQVLLNLMMKSVKQTSGGSINIHITGRAVEESFFLSFEIQDNGDYITKEEINTALRKNLVGNAESATSTEGVSPGLSVAGRVLELMGSKLGIDSREGFGNTYFFTLRQARAENAVTETAPVSLWPELASMRPDAYRDEEEQTEQAESEADEPIQVLIVDDNAMNRKVFRKLVSRDGLEVEEADGGISCLEMTDAKKYDLIFMDHLMPDIDGIETLHRIREGNGPSREAYCVALTANVEGDAKGRYMAEGFMDFLPKPMTPDRLETFLADTLPKLAPGYIAPVHLPPESSQAEATGEDTAAAAGAEIMLPTVDGMDVDFAMLHFPDKEDLLDAIDNFAVMAKREADKLCECFDAAFADISPESDMKEKLTTYRIQVHSMKSNAAMIGIVPLAGCARLLENAAGEGNADSVRGVHDTFITAWRKVASELRPETEQTQAEITEADREAFRLLVDQMNEAASMLDVDTMDALIEEMMGNPVLTSQSDLADELKAAVVGLETEEIANILSKVLGN